MGLQKNVASQKWRVFAFNITTSAPVTGDAANITAKIAKDWAAAGATNDVNPTETEDGYYTFDLTQAETNADALDLYPESATANVVVIGVPGSQSTRAIEVSLVDNAITAAKIATAAFTAAKFAADCITEAKIADNAISAEHLAANCITAAKIATAAITADKLGTACITAVKIATDAITAAKLAANAVTAAKLAANCITSSQLATDAITASQLATDAIGAAQLAANCLAAANFSDNVPVDVLAVDGVLAAADALQRLMELGLKVSAPTTTGTTTTLVDTSLGTIDDKQNVGSTIKFIAGTLIDQQAEVTAYNSTTQTLTFTPAVHTATLTSHSYVMG